MRLLACLLLALAAPAQAQIYKCTEGGKTRFSDKPITDCKSQQVTGVPKPEPVAPAAPARKDGKKAQPRIAKAPPKEAVEFDKKCASLRQEYARLQRAPDDAAREQRMDAMRSAYAACN